MSSRLLSGLLHLGVVHVTYHHRILGVHLLGAPR